MSRIALKQVQSKLVPDSSVKPMIKSKLTTARNTRLAAETVHTVLLNTKVHNRLLFEFYYAIHRVNTTELSKG